MIVVDASAALSALLNDGQARAALTSDQVHVPHLVDSEITSALRRQVANETLDANAGWDLLDSWRRLGMTRYPVYAFLDRIWQLRDQLSAYDATYVALAENLGCALLTADARLSRAPGVGCSVTVVPR